MHTYCNDDGDSKKGHSSIRKIQLNDKRIAWIQEAYKESHEIQDNFKVIQNHKYS